MSKDDMLFIFFIVVFWRKSVSVWLLVVFVVVVMNVRVSFSP